MMKLLTICSILFTGVLSSNFDFEVNNLIELDDEPYQVATFPDPYKDSWRNWVYTPTIIKENIDVTPLTHVAVAKPGLVLKVLSYIVQSAKSVVDCFLTNGSALLVGSLVAFGICQLSSLCSAFTLSDAQRELKSLASSDRIKRAAKFLEEAITKYSSMQDESVL
ncbi:hypothetical protein K1T71_006738 [Dendrolimus kikuchii]|uniref:Uncharacterized protein n=1 Tax=Dendrolimus kikuchii TaxID=765133 RepID=A0ACC1D223_9NEOP|nr:hypothetical protein K1T71_006738 [Dendrolimus kikuchii]